MHQVLFKVKINGEISDIVIQPTSSGVIFITFPYNRRYFRQSDRFIYYSEL